MRGAQYLVNIPPRAARGVASHAKRSNILDLPKTDPDGRPTRLSRSKPQVVPNPKRKKKPPRPAADVWSESDSEDTVDELTDAALMAQSPIRQCVVTRQRLPNSFLICLRPVVYHEIVTGDIDGSVAHADAAMASGEVSLRLAPAHILFDYRRPWQGFDNTAGEPGNQGEQSSEAKHKAREAEDELEDDELRHPGLVRLSEPTKQRGRSMWVTCRRDVVERLQEPGPHLRELASDAYKGLQVTPYLADQIQEQLETRVLDELAHLGKKVYARSLTQRDLGRPMPYEMIRRLPRSEVEEILHRAEGSGAETEGTPERAFRALRALEAEEAGESGVGLAVGPKRKKGPNPGQGKKRGGESGGAKDKGTVVQMESSGSDSSDQLALSGAGDSARSNESSDSRTAPVGPSVSASSLSTASDGTTDPTTSTSSNPHPDGPATSDPPLVPRALAILDLADLHRSVGERTTRPLPSFIPAAPPIGKRSRGPPVPIPRFNLAELFPETRHRATWKALQHLAQIGTNKRFMKYPGTAVVRHTERTTLMQFQTSLALPRNDTWARVMRQRFLSATRALWRLKLWHGGGWER